jgi:uncharacterized protein (TIGR00730 family)
MPVSTPIDARESWRIFRIMAEFVEGFEVMAPVGKAVSVYGSARTKPSDPMYKAAEETARLLVRSKFAVITGGGPGIMEAANKGAFEAGGTSVGLNITLPQEQEGNKYQNVSLDFHYFYARKVMFTKYADAFIYFPGGFGTMDELFEILTLVQTLKVEAFPVVLYGSKFWRGLVNWVNDELKQGFIDPEDSEIFKICDDPREAVAAIKKRWWRPLDEDLREMDTNGRAAKQLPVEGPSASTGDTGEGTRYGKRPRRPDKKHVESKKKPQQ